MPEEAGPWQWFRKDTGAVPPWELFAREEPAAASSLDGQDPGILADAVRAVSAGALPFHDRIVAAGKTLLPQSLGGSPGFDYGANLDAERRANDELRARHPVLANLGQGTGAALSALAVPAAALGRYAQGAGVLGRTALGSAAGAALGGVQGLSAAPDLAGAGQAFESGVQGAAGGAALGALFPAGAALIGKAVHPLAAALQKSGGQAELAALEAAKNAAYKNIESLDIKYTPKAFAALVSKIKSDAKASGIDPSLHQGAWSAIGGMSARAKEETPVSLPELDRIRQIVWRDAGSSPQKGDRFFGSKIRGRIDEFIAEAAPAGRAGATAQEGGDAIRTARDLASRQFKAEAVNDALNKAEIRAHVSGTGGNIENATRQRLAAIIEKEPWTGDEKKQLLQSVLGTRARDALRQASRLSPIGNALTTLLEGGGAVFHPELVGAAALSGAVAQGLEAVLRRGDQKKLMATILAGGRAQAPAPLLPGNSGSRAALAAVLAANAALQGSNSRRNANRK